MTSLDRHVHYVTSIPELSRVFLSYLPDELRDEVGSHKRFAEAIETAWANEWRDAYWLNKCAIAGSMHEDTRDPVASIVWRLIEAADEQCPDYPERWEKK